MTGALLLVLQAVTSAPAVLPTDWAALPPLQYFRPTPDDPALANFVRGEVQAKRCAAARPAPGGWALTVDVAVLVQASGMVSRTVPRAINCPSVEQYAAGLVFSRARGNVAPDAGARDGWYRTTLSFAWR